MPVISNPPDPAGGTLLFGDPHLHADGDLLALCFASDGSLWSVEEPGVIRQWNITSGKPVLFHTLSDLETIWRFSSSARLLASGSDILSVWDPKSGNLLSVIPQDPWVTSIAYHPNKPVVATGHDNGVVRCWDINSKKLLKEIKGHDQPISAMTFSPEGSRIASACEDKLIQLWDLEGGMHLGVLEGHKDRIPDLLWHPDGKTIVSAGWDTTARVWDVETREPIILLNSHSTQVHALAFTNDGKYLACADSAGSIHIWDYADKKTIHVLEGNLEFRHLNFSADGKLLASGGEGIIRLWDPLSGKSLSRSEDPVSGGVSMSLSPDGSRLITSTNSGVRIWDSKTQSPILRLEEQLPVHTLACSPDENWIAGGTDAYVRLWEAKTARAHGTLEGPYEPITTLAFSPDSKQLASGSYSGMAVWIWRIEDGEATLLIPDPLDGCTVEALAYHPDGKLLAVGGIDQFATSGSDGAISFWDIDERAEVRTFSGGATCIAFSPDGKLLASGSLEESVLIWHTEKQDLVTELLNHEDAVRTVAFSPDGKWLVSGGDDRTIRFWDTSSWKCQATKELDSQIKMVVFSPDGRILYSGCRNTICYGMDVSKILKI